MDLDDLDIGHLKVFSTMLEHRSVSNASRVLGLPQPTVSRKLACLREYFDDPLFVRTKTGMEPTPAAISFAEPVNAMLKIHRSYLLHVDSFDPATMTRTFNVAASDIELQILIPSLYAWSKNIAPKVTFNAVMQFEQPLAEGLESRDVDLVIGAFSNPGTGVREKMITEDRHVCVVKAGSPLLARPLTLEAFRAARHVVVRMRRRDHLYNAVIDLMLEQCPSENIVQISESFVIAALMLQSEDLIFILPAGVATLFREQLELEIMEPPLPLPPPSLGMYWHRRFDRDPANIWLRNAVEMLIRSGAATKCPLYPQPRYAHEMKAA
ncbi:MAG TPA: LysR family transcriptional regulator [Allosphingosinicella sp.]|nr:LysR family transcriptional regulator [Allosphingosinicella sp.]